MELFPPSPGNGYLGESEARILYHALADLAVCDSELLVLCVAVWALVYVKQGFHLALIDILEFDRELTDFIMYVCSSAGIEQGFPTLY